MSLALYPRMRTTTYRLGFFAVLAASALVTACGGGGGEDDATANPSANQAPTISGAPPGSVMQSSAYTFTPTASDANGDALTFSITNKPSWATFSTSNGALTGTPTSGDLGSYQNIQIGVSDGKGGTANLSAFSINVVATGSGSVTVNWMPPTQNTDGTALTDLAGYRIYWGTTQNNYPYSQVVSNAGLTSYMVGSLTPATYYFVITAYDNGGNESAYSNVATKTVL